MILDSASLCYDVYAVAQNKIVQVSANNTLRLSNATLPTGLVQAKAVAKKACSLSGNTLRCIIDNDTGLLPTEVVYVLEWKLKL